MHLGVPSSAVQVFQGPTLDTQVADATAYVLLLALWSAVRWLLCPMRWLLLQANRARATTKTPRTNVAALRRVSHVQAARGGEVDAAIVQALQGVDAQVQQVQVV